MKKIICLSFVLLYCFTSCKEEIQLNVNDIKGEWNLYLAERNGKETGTLKGAYFNFQSDTSYVTNVFGSDEPFSYNLINDKILPKEGEGLDLKIESIHLDTMILLTKIQKNDFRFSLVKNKE